MFKTNQSRRKRVYTILFTLIILFSLVGFDIPPQATCQECNCEGQALGDIQLDEETYQELLKPVYDDPALRDALPASYDARSEGIVTPAKNQGSCGGCWSFASVGAMESHLLKQGLPFSPTDLSEQQMISCHTGMAGCCGGSATAPQYWETTGPVYDSCYPFGDGGWSGSCASPPYSGVSCSTACPQLEYRVVNFYTVSSSDFKASLYEHGPSYFRYTVYSDFFTFWSSAASGTVYRQSSGDSEAGHAVLIIGWDDAKGAYLLKNSWGATSGPEGNGTFWMAYSGHNNNLNFGMSNFQVAPVGNAAPTNINLSSTSVVEGQPINTVVGTFTTVDPNPGDTHTYTLVSGTGSTDNASFNISGNQLRTSQVFDKEVKNTYYIRVRSTDQGSLFYEKQFTITVTSASAGGNIFLPLIINSGGGSIGIVNGGFEQGSVGWTQYSYQGWDLILNEGFTPVSAHGGDWLAWLGGDINETSRVSQSVPISASKPYLIFWYWIGSEDACGYDYARVRINGTTVKTFNLCSSNNTGGWTKSVVSLSAYTGSTVTLMFEVTTDSSFNSNFFLDDISLSSSSSSPLTNPIEGQNLSDVTLDKHQFEGLK
jgi:C1A family cysteine protease